MAKKKRHAGEEWVGGSFSMPSYVTGEGPPYRPEALVWIDPDGAVLGTCVGKPGATTGQACASLQEAIDRPMVGRPHSPARIRVPIQELADLLRAGFPNLDVQCGPTPELDAVAEAMREHLDESAEGEQSYLSPEIGPAHMAAFFQSAAALFRAALGTSSQVMPASSQ